MPRPWLWRPLSSRLSRLTLPKKPEFFFAPPPSDFKIWSCTAPARTKFVAPLSVRGSGVGQYIVNRGWISNTRAHVSSQAWPQGVQLQRNCTGSDWKYEEHNKWCLYWLNLFICQESFEQGKLPYVVFTGKRESRGYPVLCGCKTGTITHNKTQWLTAQINVIPIYIRPVDTFRSKATPWTKCDPVLGLSPLQPAQSVVTHYGVTPQIHVQDLAVFSFSEVPWTKCILTDGCQLVSLKAELKQVSAVAKSPCLNGADLVCLHMKCPHRWTANQIIAFNGGDVISFQVDSPQRL